jgi:hypothetical protein
MSENNFIELIGLNFGDWVQAPEDDSIGDNLTPLKVYQVIEIPRGALSLFYIEDDLGEVIACVIGLPDDHLNGLLWEKYNF